MSFSKKYYRKLKRQDPAKAEAYLAKTGQEPVEKGDKPWEKAFPIDMVWYPYNINYILVKTREPTEEDIEEINKYQQEQDCIIQEGNYFDHEVEVGNFSCRKVVAPVQLGDWHISVEYWVHLTKLIDSLKKNLDWEGLVNLERRIPIFLYEFKPANLSSLIEDLFKPPEEDFEIEQFVPESDFDAEQF